VGSVAVALLARLGHRVVASTGRVDELGDRLRALGAAEVIDRSELGEPGRPLQSIRWAGAVDSVGSATLVNVLAQTRWGGVVTAAGLAQGPDLPGTVLPFILRAVTLAGINSVEAPAGLRREAWARLATDLDPALLDSITTTVPLAGAIAAGERILAGASSGRVVVDVRA
jgi:acrylyl-CoA reductase (NADPH)